MIDAYKTYKSRGHVFARRPDARRVYEATAEVLNKRYGLRFRKELVGKLCHWAE